MECKEACSPTFVSGGPILSHPDWRHLLLVRAADRPCRLRPLFPRRWFAQRKPSKLSPPRPFNGNGVIHDVVFSKFGLLLLSCVASPEGRGIRAVMVAEETTKMASAVETNCRSDPFDRQTRSFEQTVR